MWNEIAVKELDENTNKGTKFCLNKITKWKYKQKHRILVESLAGLGFGEIIWCWHWEVRIQFCHANNKQVITRCCSCLVQLGINSTRDVSKFAKLASPRRLVQFWQNFQTSLVLLIPNCTRHRMITYTNILNY
jgi:hypothetical protein